VVIYLRKSLYKHLFWNTRRFFWQNIFALISWNGVCWKVIGAISSLLQWYSILTDVCSSNRHMSYLQLDWKLETTMASIVNITHSTETTCHTMVKKIPNSGFISTTSPSVKMNVGFLSFFAVKTTEICCAATDNTGSSIRLNSSKHPQLPDWARPVKKRWRFWKCDFAGIFVTTSLIK